MTDVVPTTTTPSARDFQRWILSLSWPRLAAAAQIPLTAEDESFLQEMVTRQVPPETPIHPRACPSGSGFVWDGRSPAQRRHHRRRHTPRLLHLVDPAAAVSLPPPLQEPQRRFSSNGRRNNNNNNHTASSISSYAVTGKLFIRPDGERWGIPSARDLSEADRTLLDCLVLVPTRRRRQLTADAEDDTESVLCWTGHHQTGVATATDDNHDDRVRRMYRLWRVVSRGMFGTSRGQVSNRILGTAEWLDPTERWFSLAMYLVSRLEVGLFQTFLHETSTRSPSPELLIEPYSARIWQSALTDLVKDDTKRINSRKDAQWNPRKSTIWELLDEGIVGRGQQKTTRSFHQKCAPQSSLPLLLLDSATGRLWKQLRLSHREYEARRIQEELSQDEETVKTSTHKKASSKTKTTTNKSSKKRKKKKNGKASRESNNGTRQTPPPSSVDVVDVPRKETSENDEFDEEPAVLLAEMAPTVINSREENRNRVVVLSILDDVLDAVFENVGLGKQQTDVEGLVPVGTKAPVAKQTRFTKTKPIPVPSRQTVEIDRSNEAENEKSSKAGHTPSPPRHLQSKLGARASRLEEIEENKPSRGAPQVNSSWPYYHSDFLPYSTNQMSNSSASGPSGTIGRNLQGLGADSSFDAFGGTALFRQETPGTTIWDPHHYATSDQWRTLQGLGGRDRSIMEEFFRTQHERELAKDESQMASSTIASIASSAEDADVRVEENMEVLDETLLPVDLPDGYQPGFVDDRDGSPRLVLMGSTEDSDEVDLYMVRESRSNETSTSDSHTSTSASPQAPKTRSPNQSPILVSLEDIKWLGKDAVVVDKDRDSSSHHRGPPSVQSFSSVPIVVAGSLPDSPNETKPRLTSSLSRENLRVLSEEREPDSTTPKCAPSTVSDADAAPKIVQTKFVKMKSRDDTDIRPKGYVRKATDALDSYRNAAARSLKSRDDQDLRHARSSPQRQSSYRGVAVSYRTATKPPVDQTRVFGPLPFEATESDRCVRSEIGQDEYASRRSLVVDDGDNNTVTRDGSTTITSALSQRETEETLREERDTYRDLCLTLGAEVASLKNLLAACKGSSSYPAFGSNGNFSHVNGNYQFFDPDSVSHIVQRYSRQQTMAAMSDAGYRGEHESMTSEDDITRERSSVAHRAQISATATVGGSDVSVEHSVRHETVPVAVPSLRHSYHQAPIGGFQSRLGRDILQFVDSINAQLQKQDARRAKAVERMTRLVTAVWPRAQVKVYGSHVTGLCLPSSDVDFVIGLPAVHKSPASVAPGALEGRNAINETSQKLLARKLKSESWIDPRSMLLLDRTVVPVIKVSTKDTKARSVHLDITFDSSTHHGVEAVDMVLDIIQELPMIRPLVLVLKSFLDDKNLLSAYKGGLSSYCLFLMTARYLQEQSTSWGDCGSLLMGFLDFYGNHDYRDKCAQPTLLYTHKLYTGHAGAADLAAPPASGDVATPDLSNGKF